SIKSLFSNDFLIARFLNKALILALFLNPVNENNPRASIDVHGIALLDSTAYELQAGLSQRSQFLHSCRFLRSQATLRSTIQRLDIKTFMVLQTCQGARQETT